MDPGAKIRVENIEVVLANYGGKLTFAVKGTPTFFYRLSPTGVVQKDEEQMLSGGRGCDPADACKIVSVVLRK